MAEEKSAGQVLQEHLDAMGPELGIIYNALRNEVAWVHAKWNQYRQLYARSPDRIALLNQVARHFFGVLQDVFLEDILLHLARLTDQPKVSGKDTLTLRRLPAVISGTQLKADVTNLLDTALNACKSIREFRSCAAWLSWRVGLDLGAARERVRVARALGTLPGLAEALARGELSYAKVRALTRVASPETEARLLGVGRAGTAAHVERIVRGWRSVDRKAEARETARQHASRALHVHHDEDGTVVLRGRLSPEVGALLLRALAAARETLYQRDRAAADSANVSAETPTMAQQQADALALLAEAAVHHLDPGAPGERYQVVVHVDAAALADPDQPGQSVLEDGARVSAETSRRLACDASRVVMRHDEDGRTVEVGARTRTIPPALRRALHHRDRGCCFPGCGLSFGQGHHVRHWAQGGPTTLANLALLCRRHHRAVHEEGYQVDRQPDGALRFRRPDGRSLPDVPPPVTVPADPVEVLRARHDAQGLRLHPRTACPGWLGERLDVAWAIDVLHPLATRGVGSSASS